MTSRQVIAMIAVMGAAGCGSITAVDVGDAGSGGSSGTGGNVAGTGGSVTGTGGSVTGTGGTGGSVTGTGGGGSGGVDAAVDQRIDATDSRPDADASDVPAPACRGLTETQCRARPDCASTTCTTCSGQTIFGGCYRPGVDPLPGCLGVPCPPPCSEVRTLDQCELRTDCHSVFVDKQNCLCGGLGCCATFTRCAPGDRAQCKGAVACDALEPYCEGAYVVAYANLCYEGCVQMKDCAP